MMWGGYIEGAIFIQTFSFRLFTILLCLAAIFSFRLFILLLCLAAIFSLRLFIIHMGTHIMMWGGYVWSQSFLKIEEGWRATPSSFFKNVVTIGGLAPLVVTTLVSASLLFTSFIYATKQQHNPLFFFPWR